MIYLPNNLKAVKSYDTLVFTQEIQQPRQHRGSQHIGMIIKSDGLDNTEREKESRHSQNRHPIVIKIQSD